MGSMPSCRSWRARLSFSAPGLKMTRRGFNFFQIVDVPSLIAGTHVRRHRVDIRQVGEARLDGYALHHAGFQANLFNIMAMLQ